MYPVYGNELEGEIHIAVWNPRRWSGLVKLTVDQEQWLPSPMCGLLKLLLVIIPMTAVFPGCLAERSTRIESSQFFRRPLFLTEAMEAIKAARAINRITPSLIIHIPRCKVRPERSLDSSSCTVHSNGLMKIGDSARWP